MDQDKKFVFFFYGFIGILVVVLSVFLVISIKSTTKKNRTDLDYKEIKAVNPDEEIFSSKTAAYDQVDKEKLFDVSEENVNIDFKKLFKKDSLGDDLKQKSEEFSEVQTQKTYTQERPIVYSDRKPDRRMTDLQLKDPDKEEKEANPAQQVVQKRQGFYTQNSQAEEKKASNKNVLRAAVHLEQIVKNSSVVKLRTLDPVSIEGITIPPNTIFYGEASLAQERVKIKLNSIFFNSSLYPFKYSLFDSDGIEGIYVPGMLIHDAAKEVKESVISDINVPYVGRVPVNVARKSNNTYSCILTQDYVVYLK